MSRSPIKQRLEVPIAEKSECYDTFSTAGITLRDSQICAGGEAGKDSCTGEVKILSTSQLGGCVLFLTLPREVDNLPS